MFTVSRAALVTLCAQAGSTSRLSKCAFITSMCNITPKCYRDAALGDVHRTLQVA